MIIRRQISEDLLFNCCKATGVDRNAFNLNSLIQINFKIIH